jgi:hypothetical protein
MGRIFCYGYSVSEKASILKEYAEYVYERFGRTPRAHSRTYKVV